jgi:hypothetical protein
MPEFRQPCLGRGRDGRTKRSARTGKKRDRVSVASEARASGRNSQQCDCRYEDMDEISFAEAEIERPCQSFRRMAGRGNPRVLDLES